MSFRIVVLPSAANELASLPREIQRRLAHKIDSLATAPRPPGAKMLHGRERFLRLRVSDYRIIYRIVSERRTAIIVKIGHRADIYRER